MTTKNCLRIHVGYNIKRAWDVIRADLNETLQPFDLRIITFSSLAVTVENPGLRPSQLAEALSIERANLVVIQSELEQKGLIARKPSTTDRRSYALTATKDGIALYEKAQAAVLDHDDRMQSAVDPDHLTLLITALNAIEGTNR